MSSIFVYHFLVPFWDFIFSHRGASTRRLFGLSGHLTPLFVPQAVERKPPTVQMEYQFHNLPDVFGTNIISRQRIDLTKLSSLSINGAIQNVLTFFLEIQNYSLPKNALKHWIVRQMKTFIVLKNIFDLIPLGNQGIFFLKNDHL